MKIDLFKPTIIDGEQRRNELLKISIFSILIINIFSVLLFSILDLKKYYTFIIVSIGFLNVYYISYLFYKKEKYKASKITVIASAPIQAMIGAIFFFGSDSYIQAYFVLYAILSLMLWSLKEKWFSIPMFLLNLLCFIIVEFINLRQFLTIDLETNFLTIFSLVNIVASFIILGAYIVWYHFATNIYEERIKHQRSELIQNNNGLISKNEIISETNTKLAERQVKIEKQSIELKEQREELIEINEKLHDLVATKDKFFSIIAHDLKNPMGNILGLSNILQRDISHFSADKLQNIAKVINDSSKRTYNLLENLLLWAKLQMQGMSPKIENLQLHTIIEDCRIFLNNMATGKSIVIKNKVDTSCKIQSDRYMLTLIMNNLLTNAIKFTHSNGCIEISYELNDENMAQICVSDNGIGISEKEKNNLFKIEKSISTEGTNQEKGTGLGLLLCKEFIEILGGKIWVESTEGKGSKFYFTIKE